MELTTYSGIHMVSGFDTEATLHDLHAIQHDVLEEVDRTYN